MKKFIAAFLIILVLTLSGCGEASDVGVHLTDSQRYSETELNNVVEAAKSFFAKNFDDSVTYYENQDSDNTHRLITDTYYMVTLDNGNWEVGDHGRT